MAFHKKVEKEWFTVDEVAKMFRYSRSFVITQINEGKLKAFHPNKIYRIHKDWIDEWKEEYTNV